MPSQQRHCGKLGPWKDAGFQNLDPDVRADVRADVRVEGEGREQEGRTDGVLLEHGDDVFNSSLILAELDDHVLLEEPRQRGATTLSRFPRWHLDRRPRRRWCRYATCGWARDDLHPLNLVFEY